MQTALFCLHHQTLSGLVVLGAGGEVLHAEDMDPVIYIVTFLVLGSKRKTGLALCAPK